MYPERTLKKFRRVKHFVWLIGAMFTFRSIFCYWPLAMDMIRSGRLAEFNVLRVVMAIEMVVILWSMANMRPSPEKKVVSSGPYCLVAHPAYLSYLIFDMILMVMGGMRALNITAGCLFYLVLLTAAYTEEKLLIDMAGDEARKYLRRVLSFHLFIRT